ncbi:MAG TPA: hypothetical protein VIW70_12360 [Rubrivivax sp.]
MKSLIAAVSFTLVLAGASAYAKLPTPTLTDAEKSKAAEAAARTAYAGKVDSYKLCVAMDKVAAKYLAEAKLAGKTPQPTTTPPCADPGQFAYVAPDAKPLEAAGAHSPAATAVSPPSTKATTSELAASKPKP